MCPKQAKAHDCHQVSNAHNDQKGDRRVHFTQACCMDETERQWDQKDARQNNARNHTRVASVTAQPGRPSNKLWRHALHHVRRDHRDHPLPLGRDHHKVMPKAGSSPTLGSLQCTASAKQKNWNAHLVFASTLFRSMFAEQSRLRRGKDHTNGQCRLPQQAKGKGHATNHRNGARDLQTTKAQQFVAHIPKARGSSSSPITNSIMTTPNSAKC